MLEHIENTIENVIKVPDFGFNALNFAATDKSYSPQKGWDKLGELIYSPKQERIQNYIEMKLYFLNQRKQQEFADYTIKMREDRKQ